MNLILPFLFRLVASGLRIFQDFAGLCRNLQREGGYLFVCRVREGAHKLLVPGSNPGGPTTSRYLCFASLSRLRAVCDACKIMITSS